MEGTKGLSLFRSCLYAKKSCDQCPVKVEVQLKAESSHILWDSNTQGSYSETPSVSVDST